MLLYINVNKTLTFHSFVPGLQVGIGYTYLIQGYTIWQELPIYFLNLWANHK